MNTEMLKALHQMENTIVECHKQYINKIDHLEEIVKDLRSRVDQQQMSETHMSELKKKVDVIQDTCT